VNKVEDVLKMGQEVKVKLQAIDEKGRLSLTMKGIEK
jgi:predicted RNA-binding protein with RPS1 domain